MLSGGLFALQMYVSPWPLVTSFMEIAVLTFGNGFLLPLGTALAISLHPKAAGAASGVMGSLQLGSAAVIGKISGHSPRAMATLLAVCCMIGFIIYIQKARHFMTSEIS